MNISKLFNIIIEFELSEWKGFRLVTDRACRVKENGNSNPVQEIAETGYKHYEGNQNYGQIFLNEVSRNLNNLNSKFDLISDTEDKKR